MIETKAIDDEMVHCECEEEKTTKYNLPWIDISVIAGISTALDENIFSRMLTECGQLSMEKMIIGATTANDSPYLVDDPADQEGHSDDDCDTQHSDDDCDTQHSDDYCDTQHSDDYCDTQSGDDGGSAQDDNNEQIDDHDFDEIFVAALDVSRPGTMDAKHLSNIWRIKYEDAKRTLDVTATHNVRMQDLKLAQNYGTNDRMLRYKRIHEYFFMDTFFAMSKGG